MEAKIEPRPQYEAPQYRPAGKLRGKAALVTGGDSGIGRAVALLYAREGADVALVYLPEEESDARETKKAVEAVGRKALLLEGDVKDPVFCRHAVDRTLRAFGKLDILVNNAAYQQSQEDLAAISQAQLDKTFRTNIFGYFYLCRAALPHLKKGACIINCGSVAGLRGSKNLVDYASTKAAIEGFSKSLAANLIERGIRVNCVAPGPIWTPLNVSDRPKEEVARFGKDNPMGRPGQPEEVAPAFVFLASEADSSYITGIVLPVAGGEIVA